MLGEVVVVEGSGDGMAVVVGGFDVGVFDFRLDVEDLGRFMAIE